MLDKNEEIQLKKQFQSKEQYIIFIKYSSPENAGKKECLIQEL